jgi:hypothetical protein
MTKSSRDFRAVYFDLSRIGLPYTDDMADIAALSPHQDDHALTQIANRDDTVFAIVKAAINPIDARAIENSGRHLEVEVAFSQSPSSLCRIKRNFHEMNIVYTKMSPEAFPS